VKSLSERGEGAKQAAYGVYSKEVELQQVVETLNQAGFPCKDICLLLAPAHPLAGLARNQMLLSSTSDRAATSGLINWLLRLGAVVIPRAGCFIRSRNFLQPLLAETMPSASLRKAATLSNLGIAERDAHQVASLISETGVFIYVSCSQAEQSQDVREILRNTGADEARCLYQSVSDSGTFERETALRSAFS